MSPKKWSDVRGKHVAAAGPEVVAEHAERMLARVRAPASRTCAGARD